MENATCKRCGAVIDMSKITAEEFQNLNIIEKTEMLICGDCKDKENLKWIHNYFD